ncbi:permease prefix domain 1-containing protein [Nonomuraea sp. NBC_01738]|uniref:permease prefix domain 1-containing protein n=1 Tax=Nonomuraea sp. NBC_01738 TaxID=2976003 RepID=UPI002E106E77|nr:permease prefix domain 1-containing protein [Nonomuraea sp. NBC_01738]
MLIDDYVAELRTALSGPGGPRRDMVVEARDSLVDTADAFEDEGMSRAEAEALAVREFGAVAEIAPGYQRELMACAGRRLGALLFVSVPATALAWSLLWKVFPADPSWWYGAPAWTTVASRALDYAQLAIALCSGVALLALGRGARLLGRARLVTRTLGVLVLISVGLTGALGFSLSTLAAAPISIWSYVPGAVLTVVTYVLCGLQSYGAVRCLRITRTGITRTA